ncbi:uncharacterized protein BDV14DRAFT_137702 [Aspergillus stella-maris]|uniref:uncharacterized protein n=1 Tax=Aspergillus stella-maris TaxID=1810926 RepID=UPI003CCE4DDF
MDDNNQLDGQQGHFHGSGVDPRFVSETDRDQPSQSRRAAHEPELYDIEDLPANLSAQSPGTHLVKPYAIEEPEEEPTSERKPEPARAEQRQPRSWEDLVNSMEDLYCDSDNSSAGIMSAKRGRKRKSANVYNMGGISPSGESSGSGSVPDAQYQRPSLSPKRPRKKGEQSMEVPLNLKAAQRYRVHRGRAFSGSSTTSISTNTTGVNHINGSPVPEAMDLD